MIKFLTLATFVFVSITASASYIDLRNGSPTCPATGSVFHDHFCWTGTKNQTPSCVACLESASNFEASRVIRGGQPNEAAVQKFKKIGIKVIVDMRSAGETKGGKEQRWAEQNGIVYINLPMQATVEGAQPKNETAMFRALGMIQYFLKENRSGAIYIHCQRGEDRTGLVIAGYQYLIERFNYDDVRSEMRKHYFNTNYPELYNVWKGLSTSDSARIIEPTQIEKSKLKL